MAASVRYLDSDGATTLTELNLPDVIAGNTATPKKVGVQSLADRVLNGINEAIQAVVGSDGSGMLRIAQDVVTVSRPYGFAGVLGPTADGGVWGAVGTYGWVINAISALGETISSEEVSIEVDDTTKRVTLTWTQTPNATGYRIYRTPTPGTYGASTLLTAIGSGATVSFIDDGTATGAGTPALVNTTAGWNLGVSLGASADGGVWSGTGIRYWIVVAYDASGTPIEIAQTFQGTVNVDDVTKRVTLSWANISFANSYRVYRSTIDGVYTTPALRATLASGVTSFIDDGSATTAGALTPNPSYGIPPASGSFTTGPVLFGNEQIGQQWFFWLNRITPVSTPELGNPRLALVVASES